MFKQRFSTILALLLLLTILQSCTTSTDELDVDDEFVDDSDLSLDTDHSGKVTIRWYGNNARELQYDPEAYFDKIHQKFPNIEIERYEESMENTRLETAGSDAP